MNIISVLKSTGIYFIGSVLSKIVVFLLLPIYTGYISPEAMGTYDTAVTVITLFSSMLFLDIGSVILKFTLEKECENSSYPITNGSVIFIFSCVAYLLILSFARVVINYKYFTLVVIYGLTYALNTAVGYIARAVHHNTDYAIAGVLQTLLMVILNIIMLVGFNVDYKALYISFSISSFLSTIYLLLRIHIFKHIKTSNIDNGKLVDMLKFSLPLCVNSMAFWLLSSSGRVIVTYVLGTEATGYLSVANKFNQILYLVSTCVHLTWQEAAFSHDNTNERQNGFYSKAFIIYYKVVLFCVMLLMPIVKIGLLIFPSFIDAKYSVSINLIPTALIGTGLAIVSQFLGTIFSSLKKTTTIFFSTLIGAVVTVVSTFWFIYIGLESVAANLSFIMGYIATIAMRVSLLKKHINLKCGLKNILWLVPIFLVSMYTYMKTAMMGNVLLLIIILCLIPAIFNKEIYLFRRKINEGKL